jgi:hypothetical protein
MPSYDRQAHIKSIGPSRHVGRALFIPPMDPAGAGVGPWDTDLAWHLLTVLLRIGRPTAAATMGLGHHPT